MFASLLFTTPWALAGLAALPIIWWLLRFTPPKPELVSFPPLRLLLELMPKEEKPDKTPWWLMALRLLIAALVILGVSHPLWAPGARLDASTAPLVLIVDDTAAAAPDWAERRVLMEEALTSKAEGLIIGTVPEARPQALALEAGAAALARARALEPKAMEPERAALLARLEATFATSPTLDVVWLSDGLDHGSANAFAEGLLKLANGKATLDVMAPPASALPPALAVPSIDGGRIKVTALRAPLEWPGEQTIRAIAGNGRTLSEVNVSFAAKTGKAEAFLDLPLEMRNEAARIEIAGLQSAAGVYLLDDRWRRKTVGLISGSSLEASQPLLSPLFYVARALEPFAEVAVPGDAAALKAQLDAGLSMLVMADIGVLGGDERDAVKAWIERGGVLLRFAGPRLSGGQDDLVPVTIREGGRTLGSALSWETPQALQTFPESSIFSGVALDPDVRVTRQVLAEPDADLPAKVWASLADGTPLVTGEKRGKGLVILFHVTANADWSNLPLSGMFVDMLRRVINLAPGAGGGAAASLADANAAYAPRRALSGTGELIDPLPDVQPIKPAAIETAKPSPDHPAGLYERGTSLRAINLAATGDGLAPIANLPAAATLRGLTPQPSLPLAPWLFAAALILFLADCLVALLLSGALSRLKMRNATAALAFLALMPMPDAKAQDAADLFALENSLETRLAYVLTGDAETDAASLAGMRGLSIVLAERTSVEPAEPRAIDIEKDDVVFFPLLYWPVLAGATPPSETALARMNDYMKNGGTIFFDLREDGLGTEALTGNPSGATLALRGLLAKLDIPALEPVPAEHVLTKAFYLLTSFPGRYEAGALWVERADSAGAAVGNADGVSSIIIGSNDYAAAWALDASGNPLFAVVPGGDRQREMAFRTGVNIVMYALTGNYKADQVHVPALLERLGQ